MMNIGMVGVGCISGIYLKNFAETFKNVRLVAVCDLIRERAEKAQAEYGIPKLYETMEELFAEVSALYRLDQIAASGGKQTFGPLPGESKALIGILAACWIGMGIYVAAGKIRKKKQ